MANFLPLKRYILFCLDKLITEHKLEPPFLDVGCGIGEVSHFAVSKGWNGKAIDLSPVAIKEAEEHLKESGAVRVEQKDFFDENEKFKTIFLLDILEHIEDDMRALKKLSSLLAVDGHALIAVPSNPIFWRWDDDFYGHIRRYTAKGIKKKLADVGLETLVIWDFSYPVFWIMRRIYTKINKGSAYADSMETAQEKTMLSGVKPEWQDSFLVSFLSNITFFWKWVYKIQFKFFKEKVRWGHEILILAKKTGEMVPQS